jgi:hypothetical protein
MFLVSVWSVLRSRPSYIFFLAPPLLVGECPSRWPQICPKVEEDPKGGPHTSVVEEGIRAGVKMSVHIVWRNKSKRKSRNPWERVKTPKMKSLCALCPRVIFRKVCELRVYCPILSLLSPTSFVSCSRFDRAAQARG